MKTKKLLLIALAAILLVAYYFLGTGYLKQRQDNKTLASEVSETIQILAQTPPRPTDQTQRLAAAQTSLEAEENAFPDQLNSTRIVNTILRLADDIGIKAIPLVTQAWTTIGINGHSYSVFRLDVSATGNFTPVTDFLSQLETIDIETLVIDYLAIDRITTPPWGEGVSENITEVIANLDISVYSRPPPAE